MSKKDPAKTGIARFLWLVPAALFITNAVIVGLQIQAEGFFSSAFNFNGLIFTAVAILIIARKPRQVIGWLLTGYPLLVMIDFFTENYLLAHPPSLAPNSFTS